MTLGVLTLRILGTNQAELFVCEKSAYICMLFNLKVKCLSETNKRHNVKANQVSHL